MAVIPSAAAPAQRLPGWQTATRTEANRDPIRLSSPCQKPKKMLLLVLTSPLDQPQPRLCGGTSTQPEADPVGVHASYVRTNFEYSRI